MIDENVLVSASASIKDALKKLSKTGHKTLLVVDAKKRLRGTLTDGDIRRYILKGESLEGKIANVYNRVPIALTVEERTDDNIKDALIRNKIEMVPIINKNSVPVEFITWDEAFSGSVSKHSIFGEVDLPVVIMAGGKGTRLEPFSSVFPKALVPIGEKPVVEVIIDEFRKHGITRFYMTLNHRAEMIESYFRSAKKDYSLAFVKEAEYLGTAGSLGLLASKLKKTFIVSNCDVMVRADFADVVDFHRRKKACLTVLSSIQHYKIPYGVINFKNGGEVVGTVEKPEYTFTVNAGVYVLEPAALKYIPRGGRFDMTDLIKVLVKNKRKVATYPVNENDYIDIGQWDEYKKAVEKLQLLR